MNTSLIKDYISACDKAETYIRLDSKFNRVTTDGIVHHRTESPLDVLWHQVKILIDTGIIAPVERQF